MAVTPEENRARAKAWYHANKERAKAGRRAYYLRTKQPNKGLSRGPHRYNWKGDDVSYVNLHRWVKTYRGAPTECARCGHSGPGRKYEWANVDHSYRRVLADWIRMCTRCHRHYDQENGLTSAPVHCSRCGCPHAERTEGCKTCSKRHAYYRRQGRATAEASRS